MKYPAEVYLPPVFSTQPELGNLDVGASDDGIGDGDDDTGNDVGVRDRSRSTRRCGGNGFGGLGCSISCKDDTKGIGDAERVLDDDGGIGGSDAGGVRCGDAGGIGGGGDVGGISNDDAERVRDNDGGIGSGDSGGIGGGDVGNDDSEGIGDDGDDSEGVHSGDNGDVDDAEGVRDGDAKRVSRGDDGGIDDDDSEGVRDDDAM